MIKNHFLFFLVFLTACSRHVDQTGIQLQSEAYKVAKDALGDFTIPIGEGRSIAILEACGESQKSQSLREAVNISLNQGLAIYFEHPTLTGEPLRMAKEMYISQYRTAALASESGAQFILQNLSKNQIQKLCPIGVDTYEFEKYVNSFKPTRIR